MKILIMTQYFYPESFRVNILCKELVKRGHEVTVLTGYPQYPQGKIYDGYGFGKPYESFYNGAKIERVKVSPRGKTPIGLFLNCYTFVSKGKKWVNKCKEKFDLVYVFETSPVTVGLPALAYKKKFGTPIYFNVLDLWPENVEIVLGIRNRVILSVINKIVDKIYSASDKILCSSRAFAENISNRGVSRDKLVYWPQMCDAPNFTNVSKPPCYKDENMNIVFTGNLGEAQGLDILVDAAEILKGTRVRWFLVGDGRARAKLEARVKEKKLNKEITFVGKVSEDEANRYTYFADCAYLSFKDNKLFDLYLPSKLQSYMACSAPVIAAAGGESVHLITEAGCGFICKQTGEALADLVKNQVLKCTDLERMSQNAFKYYHENFRTDLLIDRFEMLMSEAELAASPQLLT